MTEHYWRGKQGHGTAVPGNASATSMPTKESVRWRAVAKEILTCLGIAAAIGLPAYGVADWWYHKDIGKPMHGGQVRMTGQDHVELVVQPEKLLVYVTDHEGRPRDLKHTIISAEIGNESVAQPFVPVGLNSMELNGNFKLNKGMMVFVKVDRNCEQPELAVFTPMDPEPPWPRDLICTTPKPRPAACRKVAVPY